MQIHSIIFDLGAVLLNWHPQSLLRDFTDDVELQQSLHEQVLSHPDWLELDRGTLKEHEIYQHFAKRCAIHPQMMESFFEHVRESLTLMEETKLILEALHDQGFHLYCLSNMSSNNFEFVKDRYDFFDCFKGIVVSGYLQMIKPELDIFHYLLDLYQLEPTQTLFIDDSMHNVDAAESIGINSIHFTDADSCRATLCNRFGIDIAP